MDKIRPVMIFFAVICLVVAAYFLFRTFISVKQEYSWEEMDWDKNGTTSIREFFEASDIGKREVIQGNKKCVEYFAYKDGLPVKMACPN